MAVTLRYFIEFGKPVFQHVSASICGGINALFFARWYDSGATSQYRLEIGDFAPAGAG